MKKTLELGTKQIGKLLAEYSIPAVIAMLVNAIYNIVDRIFIGKFSGEEALAGLTVSFPLMMIIFAFAGLVGAGGAALLSIRLGKKDYRGASHVFGNAIGLGILITGVTLITLFMNLNYILALFGANDFVVKFAEDYMRIILTGFIFQMISFILNTGVRAEGRPLFSMTAMMLSAITNILLDYVFIVILGWGVKGAALATISGQLAGLTLLLSFYLRGKSNLHFKFNDFIPDFKIARDIIFLGFSSFITTIGTSISMVFLTRGLSRYGGTAAISSMGAINSLYTLFIMPIMGIQQGMQPILGYNYGAGLTKRVNQTLKITLAVAIIFSTIVFLCLELFPSTFITLFLDRQSDTVAIAVRGLRIFILLLPLLSINIIGIAYFQSTANGRLALGLSLLRQFVFLIPLVLILPLFFDLTGVWAATPIADGLAILIALIVLIQDRRKRNLMYQAAKNPLTKVE